MMQMSGPKFDRVNVEIINTCNLKCSFCPTPERQMARMSVEQFSNVARTLKPMTKEVVLHLLGEPLSHPQFSSITQAASDAALPLNIVTNGLLLTGERVTAALHPVVRQISISLQSFGDNFPDQNPETYVAKIKSFTDRAQIERPDLYLNLRFWDLDGIGATETNHNQELRREIAKAYNVDWDGLSVDVRRKKNHKLSGRLYLHFDSRFTWPSMDNPILQDNGFCHGLKGHFGIHADGTVVPCCLDHQATIALGNIFSKPLEEILESPRARAMKEGFKRGELVEDLCKRCGYIERFR